MIIAVHSADGPRSEWADNLMNWYFVKLLINKAVETAKYGKAKIESNVIFKIMLLPEGSIAISNVRRGSCPRGKIKPAPSTAKGIILAKEKKYISLRVALLST